MEDLGNCFAWVGGVLGVGEGQGLPPKTFLGGGMGDRQNLAVRGGQWE